MKVRLFCIQLALFLFSYLVKAQENVDKTIFQSLALYFQSYTCPDVVNDDAIRLKQVSADSDAKTVTVVVNESFASQPFTRDRVWKIYKDIVQRLPSPYNTYKVRVFCNETPLEEYLSDEGDESSNVRRWGDNEYKGIPWVMPASRVFSPKKGLQNKHISLWASHGKYYDLVSHTWMWQRPRLYCTTEDLFTQSFVVPFLIPMLENAGALVFTPRERDWQRNEVIVDNDAPERDGLYQETNGTYAWENSGPGFYMEGDVLMDCDTPFTMGTARFANAQTGKRGASSIVWKPNIPKDGDYAVYVSYPGLSTNVVDACYTVVHRGMRTKFKVNQKMGAGTWVYLGTFNFSVGNSNENCVILTNVSNYRGVVAADAVRFGGGMGNVARCDSLHAPIRSTLPRYLEGSRYQTQWSGMPYSIYGTKSGTNDYGEDINARSLMTNFLAQGSVYCPADSGLCVPIELSLAFHSDAGLRKDNTIVGTLGIYTTGKYTAGEYDGLLAEGLFPSGVSRMTSRDLCDCVMGQVQKDMSLVCGNWTRRQMYDRNYSETRLPKVPAIILESLSHQNWADMYRGHDPWFKFLFARSVYKGLLAFSSNMHNQSEYVVQPMPITHFFALLNEAGDSVTLQWQAGVDPTGTPCAADAFCLYTRVGASGYDNGQKVYANNIKIAAVKGEIMRFRVTALNDGGQSMYSEELCVYSSPKEKYRMLVVNGFTRLAGPQPIDNDSIRGFDMNIDPGVVYRYSPCYSGKQIAWSKNDWNTLGESGSEYEGILVAGNTFDYPGLHADDMLAQRDDISLSSCSRDAFEESDFNCPNIRLLDYICGAQREDKYSLNARPCFEAMTLTAMEKFSRRGASVLLSGAYLSESISDSLAVRCRQLLHVVPGGYSLLSDTTNTIQGMGTEITLYNDLNPVRFSTRRTSVLTPVDGAFCTLLYQSTNYSAAVAFQNENQRSIVFGFPLEMITDDNVRRSIYQASINYLIP